MLFTLPNHPVGRYPIAPLIPNTRPAIPPRGIAIHPSEAIELRLRVLMRLGLPSCRKIPRQRHSLWIPIQLGIDISPPPLDVIDQDTDAVDAGLRGQRAPAEGDVRVFWPNHGGYVRRSGTPPGLALVAARLPEGGRRLNDGGKAPADDAVDEEAEQQTLVDEGRARLHGGPGHKEDAKDVVMNPEPHAGENEEDQETDEQGEVKLEVFGQLARDADVVNLDEDDADNENNDDGES